MTTARFAHTATLLPSGQVLVLGGYNRDTVSSRLLDKSGPDLYDSGTNSWTRAGSMVTNRDGHTATLLRNGQVLVIGGDRRAAATAEWYDPATKSSSLAAPMTTARSGGHTATLLRDGQTLLLGGYNYDRGGNRLATVELYQLRDTWVNAKSMTAGRAHHSATLLSNGEVLVVGGYSGGRDVLATAERYDTTTNRWASAGKMTVGRRQHTATLLTNGQVLAVGGWSNIDNTGSSATAAELYDPAANTWISGGTMATAHAEHTATLLPNGQVLVIGGGNDTVERYDPTTNSWASAGRMTTARKGHTATLLPSGQVLVAGGYTSREALFLATAELCAP